MLGTISLSFRTTTGTSVVKFATEIDFVSSIYPTGLVLSLLFADVNQREVF
jgi:hypothetical protein